MVINYCYNIINLFLIDIFNYKKCNVVLLCTSLNNIYVNGD